MSDKWNALSDRAKASASSRGVEQDVAVKFQTVFKSLAEFELPDHTEVEDVDAWVEAMDSVMDIFTTVHQCSKNLKKSKVAVTDSQQKELELLYTQINTAGNTVIQHAAMWFVEKVHREKEERDKEDRPGIAAAEIADEA
eukprot:7455050-Pyramimonas_sp.AAC.1